MRAKAFLAFGLVLFLAFPARAMAFWPFSSGVPANRAHVSGLVSDPLSRPVAGATVTLRGPGGEGRGKSKERKTKTDSKGNFNFGDVDFGTYTLTCEKDGYRTETRTLYISDSQPRTVSITLGANALSQKMISIGKVDSKTARVFITYASLEMQGPQAPSAEPAQPDMPYSTIPEMGALLYGGKGALENMPQPPLLTPNPTLGSSALPSLNENNISVLDEASHQIVAEMPTDASPVWIAFSRGGSRFWTIDSQRNLSMYSGSGDFKNSVNVGENLVTDFAVGERNLYLAARTWPDPLILTVDAVNNALTGNFPLPKDRGQPGGIALSQDQRTLLVTMGTPTKGRLLVMDAESGKVLKEIEVGAQPLGVGISPDGSTAVVACYSDTSVDVVDLTAGKIVNHIQSGIMPARVAVRPDGRVVFVSNNGDDSVSVIDLRTGMLVKKIPVGKGPMGLAVTPDGSTLYVANNASGNVTTVDAQSFSVLSTTPQTPGSQVFGVAVRP